MSSGAGQQYCAKGKCGVAVTPPGAFRVNHWKPGWDDSRLGELYNPVYFNPRDGIAIHGFQEVPTEPASHGCVRIPMAAAEWFPTPGAQGHAGVRDRRPGPGGTAVARPSRSRGAVIKSLDRRWPLYESGVS